MSTNAELVQGILTVINEQKQKLTTLSNNAQILDGQVNILNGQITDLNSQITDLNGQITALTDQLQAEQLAHTADITTISEAMQNLVSQSLPELSSLASITNTTREVSGNGQGPAAPRGVPTTGSGQPRQVGAKGTLHIGQKKDDRAK